MYGKFFAKKKFRKLGVALGGGAALGAAHVEVLKAFREKGISPEYISGTSIGAFVAAHIAFGASVEELEALALDMDWFDVTGFKISKMGLLGNDLLGKLVLEQLGKVNIVDAKILLCMISTDISTGKKVVLKEEPLCKAIMASICLPGIFTPVE